jgi:hypothetical protein
MLLSFTKGPWVFGIVRNVITNITSYNANPHYNHSQHCSPSGRPAADPPIRRSAADLKSQGIAASYVPPLFLLFTLSSNGALCPVSKRYLFLLSLLDSAR